VVVLECLPDARERIRAEGLRGIEAHDLGAERLGQRVDVE
jgi:hypothetical protein